MLFSLLQTEIAQAAPVQQEMSYSLIEMAAKGGWLMLVLLLLSILAIYIFGKKWWVINKAGKIDKDFLMDIRDYIHDGKIKSALTLCSKYDSPVARMIEAGIVRIGKPASDIQAAIENVGNVEVARLEKGLPYLATIAGGAPMIGFLGTVIGMIQAFDAIQAAGDISPNVVAGGMKVALITTVAGLIVAMILQVFYNYILSLVEGLVNEMEDASISLLDIVVRFDAAKK